MNTQSKDTISKELGVEPILINSALVSAQKRNRYYWTNISFNPNILDRNILVQDVLDKYPSTNLYLTAQEIEEISYKKKAKKLPNNKAEGTIEFPQSINRKSLCLLATDGIKSKNRTTNFIQDGIGIRRLSVLECERLQTLPDNYTEGVSTNQRYKMIGNGWTVDIISEIFKGLLT